MNTPRKSTGQLILSTANSAVAEVPAELMSDCIATANALPEQLADGWHVLAPFGEFPSPDGRYVQCFGPQQAATMLRSWNSITGRFGRLMKNAVHRRKSSLTMPVYDAPAGAPHPDLEPLKEVKTPIIGEVTELRTSNAGLEGFVKWTEAARAGTRQEGPLFPSVNWWHERPDSQGCVFPEHIESVTLTRTPNIRTVPAWTANTLPQPATENQTIDPMNKEQLEALRRALGLPETADPHACIQAATTANASIGALATANSTITALNTERDTIRTANTAIISERDTLKTANTALVTERDALKTANASLTKGILDAAEKRGLITPAERAGFETRISTANTSADALAELASRKPALNTSAVDLNGARHDISTANARQSLVDAEVNKRMKANGTDYDTEFAAVKADKNFAAVFAAMQDPTKAAA